MREYSNLVAIETLISRYYSFHISLTWVIPFSLPFSSSPSSVLLYLHPWTSRDQSTTAVSPARWARPWATRASAPARLPALRSAPTRTLQARTTTVSSQVRLIKHAGGQESSYCYRLLFSQKCWNVLWPLTSLWRRISRNTDIASRGTTKWKLYQIAWCCLLRRHQAKR